jgi:hypothetical protein
MSSIRLTTCNYHIDVVSCVSLVCARPKWWVISTAISSSNSKYYSAQVHTEQHNELELALITAVVLVV